MLNIMELPPPIFCISFRDMNCPRAMKIRMGATQLRIFMSREVCSISSPLVETPASSSRWTSWLSVEIIAVL